MATSCGAVEVDRLTPNGSRVVVDATDCGDPVSDAGLVIRPITEVDREMVAHGFRNLSVESRYQRFFTVTAELGIRQLAYLTTVDHHDHEALIAVVRATGQLVGVARFVRSTSDPASAEVAFVVADLWQHRGLGTELLRHLLARARQESINRFTADILAGNDAMLALFRRLGPVEVIRNGSVLEVAVDLIDIPAPTD